MKAGAVREERSPLNDAIDYPVSAAARKPERVRWGLALRKAPQEPLPCDEVVGIASMLRVCVFDLVNRYLAARGLRESCSSTVSYSARY